MAKYERYFKGDFDQVLGVLHEGIMSGSVSASYEDGSDCSGGGVRCALRVYERFSYMGGNRLSLSMMLVGQGEDLFLSAVASGGSRGVFVKINTFGEEAFLEKLIELAEQFI